MPSPATFNIEVYRRERLELQFVLSDEDSAPIDLTGSTVTTHVRKADNQGLILDLEASIDDAPNGSIVISKLIGETIPGSYLWDMLITFPADTPLVIIQGTFKINPTISIPA